MSTFVWKKLKSQTLQPLTTTICAYDDRTAQPQGILMNVPVELAKKSMLIDIEVVNTQLDYNLLLGGHYIYAM